MSSGVPDLTSAWMIQVESSEFSRFIESSRFEHWGKLKGNCLNYSIRSRLKSFEIWSRFEVVGFHLFHLLVTGTLISRSTTHSQLVLNHFQIISKSSSSHLGSTERADLIEIYLLRVLTSSESRLSPSTESIAASTVVPRPRSKMKRGEHTGKRPNLIYSISI